MKESPLQLTLREMRTLAASRRAWGIMGVVALILGISGPFQTFEYLALGPRIAYWAVMSVLSFATGSFFGTWIGKIARDKKFGIATTFLLTSFGSGLPVAIIVILLNIASFNSLFTDIEGMLVLAAYSVGISMAIVALFMIFDGPAVEKCQPETAQILARLPVEKRGELISMSVQDHYVEVVTSRGKHLTLVRLSDAINETRGTAGMQIHRSHWVALAAIQSVTRKEGKVLLRTQSGTEFPVSRTYLPHIKEAGLLV